MPTSSYLSLTTLRPSSHPRPSTGLSPLLCCLLATSGPGQLLTSRGFVFLILKDSK